MIVSENTASNLISYLSITVFMVIFSSFGLADFNWHNNPDSLDSIKFDLAENSKLSEDGRVALHELSQAKSFSLSPVGAGGHYSQEYNSFAILMHEKQAPNALKTLVNSSNVNSQAYGLVGLNILQPESIIRHKAQIKNSHKNIIVRGGCLFNKTKISAFLFSQQAGFYKRLNEKLIQRYQKLKENNMLFIRLNSEEY